MSQTSSESILFSLVWKIRVIPLLIFHSTGGILQTQLHAPTPHCLLIRSARRKMLASTLLLQRNSYSRLRTERVVEFGIAHQYSNSKITFFP